MPAPLFPNLSPSGATAPLVCGGIEYSYIDSPPPQFAADLTSPRISLEMSSPLVSLVSLEGAFSLDMTSSPAQMSLDDGAGTFDDGGGFFDTPAAAGGSKLYFQDDDADGADDSVQVHVFVRNCTTS
jgi:hypothetical protein